jgi:hypothetical protein
LPKVTSEEQAETNGGSKNPSEDSASRNLLSRQNETKKESLAELPSILTAGQRVVPAIPQADRNSVLNVLLTMFNVGSDLMGYQDDIDTFNEEALHRLMAGNPFRNLCTPSDTGRPQAEARDLILSIIQAAMDLGDGYYSFSRLHVLKYYDGKFYVHYDDPTYQLGAYLSVLLKMAQWSLSSSLILGGMWLMSTASYYHHKLTRRWLGGTTLNFDELTEENLAEIDAEQGSQPEEQPGEEPEIIQEEKQETTQEETHEEQLESMQEEEPEIIREESSDESQEEEARDDKEVPPDEFPEIIREEIEENK